MVVKEEVLQRDPWVALNLYKALCQAKEHCYNLVSETGSPKASFAWLQPMIEHMARDCVGQIAEIFEGDEPHRPGGCPAQAWSVAEVLRCLVKTAG